MWGRELPRDSRSFPPNYEDDARDTEHALKKEPDNYPRTRDLQRMGFSMPTLVACYTEERRSKFE